MFPTTIFCSSPHALTHGRKHTHQREATPYVIIGGGECELWGRAGWDQADFNIIINEVVPFLRLCFRLGGKVAQK